MSDRPGDWRANLAFDPTAFVAPGATVVGDVSLGAHTSVWFGTVIRGDTAPITIGAHTNLQDLTLVHVDHDAPTVVGARVTVGHRAIIHGCTIGDDCLIGMGAIVLSHARIGAGSLIGAGALVKEGQEIPPGSLALGAPAKVIGPVNDAHRAAIAQGATHYAELAQSYLARGHARAFAPRTSDAGITPGGPGPMTYAEWGGLLATFAESPEWIAERIAGVSAARLAQRPGPERWSALEVLAHLRDCDRDVFLPRLELLLTQSRPSFTPADLTSSARVASYAGADAAAVLAEWRELRKRFVTRLAPLGRDDWARVALHPSRGSYPLGDMMREWAEHDRSHRRQLALALDQTP